MPNRRVGFATHVLPGALYTALLFYTGLIRIGKLPEVGFVATDKLLHALVFGGLALLIARAAHWFGPLQTLPRKLFLGALGSSFAGMVLEVCQAFTTWRSADLWDWVADSIGAALFTLACLAALSRRRAHG